MNDDYTPSMDADDPETPDREHQATLDVLAHIVSQANVNAVDGDDGFIARYNMPVGSIHKAIPHLARYGISVDNYGGIHRQVQQVDAEEGTVEGNALCGATVPLGIAWEVKSGEYASSRFTVKRDLTTCPDCVRRLLRAEIAAQLTLACDNAEAWTCTVVDDYGRVGVPVETLRELAATLAEGTTP
jgi:hypothetical protein